MGRQPYLIFAIVPTVVHSNLIPIVYLDHVCVYNV